VIYIALGPEPTVLEANGFTWGEEYDTAIQAGGSLPHRYQHEDIKEALRSETHGKCAYCESYIEHVSFSHIEHILPKSLQPLLVCSWQNLTLACQKCNTYKGDYYVPDAPLLNPYLDPVEAELAFYGPMAIDRSDKAKLTVSRLRLNRPDLLFRREGALRTVLQILDLLTKASENKALVEALRAELQDKMVAAAEYASCTKNFISAEAPRRGHKALVEEVCA
jgi:hypothetical protein